MIDPLARHFKGNRVVGHTGSAYPIIQAPMTWIARAPLVSAVSAAGGLGLLENSSANLAITRREFEAIATLTSNPFGMNLPVNILKANEGEEGAIIDWLVKSGVRFVTTSAGDPTRYIKRLKDADVIVYHSVPTLSAALKASDAGVDGLIVEGAESAGIRNEEEVHSFVLLQAVRERVELPLVAAGGIVDGRGMAAAFALGAEGVAMGTRFVASFESPVHNAYKDAIVSCSSKATLLLSMPPRAKLRALRTVLTCDVEAGARAMPPLMNVVESLYQNGDVENSAGAAGESATLIHAVCSVESIINTTVTGFWRELDRLAELSRNSRC